MRRTWWSYAAAGVLLAGCGTVAVAQANTSDVRVGHYLPVASGLTGHPTKVGTEIEFQLPIDPPARQAVILEDVTFKQLPAGLTITGLHAYDRRATAGGFVVITAQDKRENNLRPLPFKGLELRPHSTFYATVGVVAQRPGHYIVKQEDITYRVGSKLYHQIQDWDFEITAS
jgi:hypothetical protein